MVKSTKKDFELFKKECLYWVDRFQLNDFYINFEHTHLNGHNAEISVGRTGGVTVRFSTDIHPWNNNFKESIKTAAKHEMCHLLLGRYAELAESRSSTLEALETEEEHLVLKLVNIIK